MIGNIVIIAITICIVLYVMKVFCSNLKYIAMYSVSAIVATLVLVFSILIPNLSFIKEPFTPKIYGKVIDAETNQPIPNVTIIVDWGYTYSEFPMHSYGASTNQKVIHTNRKGEFIVDKGLKCLAVNMYPLYNRDNGGVGILALYPQYKHVLKKLQNSNDNIVTMYKIYNYYEYEIDSKDLVGINEIVAKDYNDVAKKTLRDHIINNKYPF